MLVLAGTVPYKTGLYIGQARIEGGYLNIENVNFPIERGTAAMAASAVEVCKFYGLESPLCIFGGDIADGKGTDLMFQELNSCIDKYDPQIITLHYMFPKISYGKIFLEKINTLARKPQLIADAGGMYLAKTIDKAYLFDVFTPDEGELYFLADEYAPHPLYVRTELQNKDLSVAALIDIAYKNRNTAKTTVVKGKVDYIYRGGAKLGEVSAPDITAMEAVGGTGDTITGMLSALKYKGDMSAESKALNLNMVIGERITCRPSTQISEFIRAMPRILEEYEKKIQ